MTAAAVVVAVAVAAAADAGASDEMPQFCNLVGPSWPEHPEIAFPFGAYSLINDQLSYTKIESVVYPLGASEDLPMI